MTYDEFRAAFMRALRESGLPGMGSAEETLDLRTLDRTLQVRVEPVGGQRTEPFYATATISWRWSALQTTRGIFREEDTLRELLGHDEDVDTERPSLRVDIHLAASTMVGKPVPMPTKQKWADWAREALGGWRGARRSSPKRMCRRPRMVASASSRGKETHASKRTAHPPAKCGCMRFGSRPFRCSNSLGCGMTRPASRTTCPTRISTRCSPG